MKITVVNHWMDNTMDIFSGPTTRIVMDLKWEVMMEDRAFYGNSLYNEVIAAGFIENMQTAMDEYKTRSVGPMEESSLESCPVCDEQAKVRFLHAPPPRK